MGKRPRVERRTVILLLSVGLPALSAAVLWIGRLFVEEARKHPRMHAKLDRILRDGVVKFLDYAIELRQKEPEVLEDLLDDYLLSSTMRG